MVGAGSVQAHIALSDVELFCCDASTPSLFACFNVYHKYEGYLMGSGAYLFQLSVAGFFTL